MSASDDGRLRSYKISVTRGRSIGIGLSLAEATGALLALSQFLRCARNRLLRDDESCERSLRSAGDNGPSGRSHYGSHDRSRGRGHISSVGSSESNGDRRTRDGGVSRRRGSSSCDGSFQAQVGNNLCRCFLTWSRVRRRYGSGGGRRLSNGRNRMSKIAL